MIIFDLKNVWYSTRNPQHASPRSLNSYKFKVLHAFDVYNFDTHTLSPHLCIVLGPEDFNASSKQSQRDSGRPANPANPDDAVSRHAHSPASPKASYNQTILSRVKTSKTTQKSLVGDWYMPKLDMIIAHSHLILWSIGK